MKIFYLKFLFFGFHCLVSFKVISQTFIPGKTYIDPTGYVEYRAGNLPIIISAPHGGNLEPNAIPDRNCTGCITERDAWTKAIAEGMYNSFIKQTGCYPHVIINLLDRSKFDANRDLKEAANGNATVEKAWYEYHKFIDSAKSQVIKNYSKGLFLDLHGHGHTIQKIELGYLLSASQLRLSDSVLNGVTYIKESSIRTLAENNAQNISHAKLLRGQNSFGTLMSNKGFPAVPSFSDPFPQVNQPYFDGGYNTQRHGSRDNGGKIDAIQIELNNVIRNVAATRERLIDSLTNSSIQYIQFHYNKNFLNSFCNRILTNKEADNQMLNFNIYPNPAENYIRIDSQEEGLHIEIYNYFGQKLHSEMWIEEKMNIGFLPNGLYIIKLAKDHRILGSKVFIKY